MDSQIKTKLLIFRKILISIVIWIVFLLLFSILLGFFFKDASLLAPQFAFIMTSLFLIYLIDKKDYKSIGINDKNCINNAFYGIIGGVLITFLSVILMIFFADSIISNRDFNLSLIVYQMILFLLVAIGEELYFRGYILQIFDNLNNPNWSLFISTIFFALIHLLNPNSLSKPFLFLSIEIVNIFLLGFLFAIARFKSGGLIMPIALHFSINFIQSSIFGFVNGGKKMDSLFNIEVHRNSILNGSGYGLESSLILTIISISTIYFLKNKNYKYEKNIKNH
ncbi:lysostaphin resistance A-like protein [Flavobacterium sp.]|jgi:membrane protease YdiL (CAAX protease family)|uniref:lysostaphin resistance A-like protein n=1 Tax=Flavobacterium sp. TaxID=239 RepID=UPI0037C0D858